ncbi:hypothetical protein HanXRQr2_Chr11g0520291 [Helianthus annuus]|uniref:Uncharacterized protein n=1 Tax=Helianthus annuus TaxID=4232 RepID=A0A251TFW8_HELAN|nr:uncharacterized protein LOC110891523 [Helianthus annuus]KAF5784508.1 hypothetical protein HanXRQr2_Chr11g0520291 [Helianthus annuus]
MVTKKKNMKKERAITSDNLLAELLLSLKPSPDVTIAPNPSDCYDGDPAVKVVDSTTTVCNISRKRKLDELNPATADAKYSPECMLRNKDWLDDAELCRDMLDPLSTPAAVLANQAMSDEDLSSRIRLLLVKLSCLTPELLSRYEHSLKVAKRKSNRVERYKRKVADKDAEIRQLKEEVENLKRDKTIAKKEDLGTSKVKEVIRCCLDEITVEHQKEVSVLKTCLHDVQAQLEYKDRLLVEGVTELDSVEDLLVAERDRHSAKEQAWVEETQTLNESLRFLKHVVDGLLVDRQMLKDDRKWLISEGFAHVINNVHRSDEFLNPCKDFTTYATFTGLQRGLKLGYHYSAQGVAIEKLDFYRPRIEDKMKVACRWLCDLRLPYVETLSSMVDQPLDVIRGLEPERQLACKVSDTRARKKIPCGDIVASRVDEYLKQLKQDTSR